MKTSSKILLGGLIFVVITILFFILDFKSQVETQLKEYIKSSGVEITKEIPLSGFKGIEVDHNLLINIHKGEDRIQVTGDSGWIQNIEFEIKDSILHISSKPVMIDDSEMETKITIHCTQLEKLNLLGSGTITMMDTFNSENVLLVLAGSGEINTTFISNNMNIEILGSGDLKNIGSSEFLNITISGSGEVDCKLSPTKNANLEILGSGEIIVDVADKLQSTISGSGTVQYLGNPKIQSENLGSGELKPYEK